MLFAKKGSKQLTPFVLRFRALAVCDLQAPQAPRGPTEAWKPYGHVGIFISA